MKKNDEYTVECTGLSDLGFGVCRVEGMTVFVPDLLEKEKARIHIIKVFKNYAIGKVMERYNSSPDRQTPRCPHAARCGGCSFQHLKYPAQLALKHKELQRLFHQVDSSIEVLPVLGMENPYFYRNKAQFPVRVENGKIVSGFYRPKTNSIIDMDECAIQSPEINTVYQWIRKHLPVESARPLRHIFIRASKNTGQVQVVLIGRENKNLGPFSEKLTRAFPEIVSVVFNRNTREDNVILSDEYEVLQGSDSLLEDCLGLKIQLHFKSFFQVNPEQMEVLYSKALEMADLQPEDRVVELYAGTGTIGMLASRKAGSVEGVEIVEDAVRNANENLKLNQIENARYICMDATEYARKASGTADVVITDPPRKGMDAQGIENILTLSPSRIVYISCNPRTLARDLEVFSRNGYHCTTIQPVDMFAQTTGVECAALIVKDQPQPEQK